MQIYSEINEKCYFSCHFLADFDSVCFIVIVAMVRASSTSTQNFEMPLGLSQIYVKLVIAKSMKNATSPLLYSEIMEFDSANFCRNSDLDVYYASRSTS